VRHGHGEIENQFLNRTEHTAFLIVRKVSQFVLCDTVCSALGRA
jgi:hypothetical protein